MLRRERHRKKQNRLLRQQMVFLQQLKSVLPMCSLPPVREVGGWASVVQHAVLQEDRSSVELWKRKTSTRTELWNPL